MREYGDGIGAIAGQLNGEYVLEHTINGGDDKVSGEV
jgi:hypothetical protein